MLDDVDEGLAVEAQRHRAPQVRAVERRLFRIEDQVAADIGGGQHALRLRRLVHDVLQQRYGGAVWRGDVVLAGDERQVARRIVRHDLPLDTVDIGPPRLPVIRVARGLDHLVRPELDEFEGPCADRLGAHFPRRHMAWINRRPSGRQQRQECRLRPLQVEGGLVIAVRTDLFEVEVPGLARVHAQLFAAAAEQQFPGAFDVGGGKGLSVVPLDALPQFERQLLAVLAPGPAFGEVGADRLRAVLRDLLVVHDQVVENAHARPQRRAGRLLVQRQARRVVEKRDLQNTAGFLRPGRAGTERKQQ